MSVDACLKVYSHAPVSLYLIYVIIYANVYT